MAAARRNLRHSNTCPLVQNPLKGAKQANALAQLLPLQISHLISTSSTLSCSQIISLPDFGYLCTAEESLALMERAAEWQAQQIGQAKGESSRSYDGATPKELKTCQLIADDALREVKSEHQREYNQEVLFANDFRDFTKHSFDFQQFHHHPSA